MKPIHKKLGKIAPQINRLIKGARRIIIASHIDPDPDAFGSQLGLWQILRSRYPRKSFYLYNPTRPVSPKYRLIKGAARIKTAPPKPKYDVLIGLDAGSFSRLGLDKYVARYRPEIIFIDHHESIYRGDGIAWIEKDEESASQLIYELAEYLHWPVSKAAAEALMIGMTGDTLHFARATSHAFDIAAKLARKKPDFVPIEQEVFGWPNWGTMQIFGKVFLRAKFIRRKRFIYSYTDKKEMAHYGVKPGELAYFTDSLRNFIETEVALFLRQKKSGIWEGSLRSTENHPADLAILAKKLGGGGHKHSSGFEAKLPKAKILETIVKSLPDRR